MAGYIMRIMFMSGPDDGQEIELSRENQDGYETEEGVWTLVFGRREECDVSIPFDTQVSRKHALLRIHTDGQIVLVDTGSLNGTYIGEKRIEQPASIRVGELFRLGRTWLRIQR